MPEDLGPPAEGRTAIIAVGKAAAAMASVAAARLGAAEGLVVTRGGHSGPPHDLPPGFTVIEAGHPVPDIESLAAAEAALAIAESLGPRDRLLALISGGGSALMSLPPPGVPFADKQAVTRGLLRSGATIAEINCVRKHLSCIKGGRLARAAAPAPVTTLLISDIPGDDPSLVASGPTVADRSSLAEARAILARRAIACPPSVAVALADSANETPDIADGDVRILARAHDALTAAQALAEARGYAVTDLGDRLEGEARDLGAAHAAFARAATGGRVILSGGETTVTVTNPAGRGGRNLEYLLGLAIALAGDPRISAIACDTDGIDGTEANAGAIVTPDTLARASALGLDAAAHLAGNDAWGFFNALGDLVVTGPTRTNVNDFRAILVDA